MQKKAAEEGTKGDTGGDDDDVPGELLLSMKLMLVSLFGIA
jgi:hypothetical protein